MNTAEITHVPIGDLKLDEANPREHIDKERLATLTDSVRKYGVIQPLLVRLDDDQVLVVAGQRRLLAAIDAGLEEVPVYVRDINGAAAALSLVENLEREQLTPIEEANAFKRAVGGGMTIVDLAAAIGRSEQLVKDRLALLELPAKVQTKVDAGELTLRAAAALPKLAPAGAAIMEKAAELVTRDKKDRYDEQITVEDLANDPGLVLEAVLDEFPSKDLPFIVQVWKGRGLGIDQLPWPKTVGAKALKAKFATVPNIYSQKTYSHSRSEAMKVTQDDLDAARAFGCLLELDGKLNGETKWITDPVWLADRLDVKMDKAIASAARKAKTAAKADGASAEPVGPTTAEKKRREAVRAANAKAKATTLAKREKNITLGIALYKDLHAPKVTADAMRLIGELLFEYAGDDLGRCGLRYVDETCQTVETLKSGAIKVVRYPTGAGLLEERLAKATTAEQILGVILQAVVAARYADVEAAATNDRRGRVRGMGTESYARKNATLLELVDKIAAPVLPAGTAAKTPKRSTAARRPAARRRRR